MRGFVTMSVAHRGARLCGTSGHSSAIQCPYPRRPTGLDGRHDRGPAHGRGARLLKKAKHSLRSRRPGVIGRVLLLIWRMLPLRWRECVCAPGRKNSRTESAESDARRKRVAYDCRGQFGKIDLSKIIRSAFTVRASTLPFEILTPLRFAENDSMRRAISRRIYAQSKNGPHP